MKKLGFGMMRLPMIGDEVDIEQTKQMVDEFMSAGFTYFDTAHGYIGGKSELAVKAALSSRYPRESYVLANKLSSPFFEDEAGVRRIFEEQLEACGVEYFDYYLIHAMNASNYKKYTACNAYGVTAELKKAGKVRHVGMSFHDSPDVLDMILTEHPETEFVQIQYNYLDYYAKNVQSKGCLDVCLKHKKPVIVMEPVKGGKLANLPNEASEVFRALGDDASDASYAVRFAASAEGVFMVLSGMSNVAQLEDNISYMKDFVPLSDDELKACEEAREICNRLDVGKCTGCRYCVDGCPSGIAIPNLMDAMNKKRRGENSEAAELYGEAVSLGAKAMDCISCGHCEEVCPQKLHIRRLLGEISEAFGEAE